MFDMGMYCLYIILPGPRDQEPSWVMVAEIYVIKVPVFTQDLSNLYIHGYINIITTITPSRSPRATFCIMPL